MAGHMEGKVVSLTSRLNGTKVTSAGGSPTFAPADDTAEEQEWQARHGAFTAEFIARFSRRPERFQSSRATDAGNRDDEDKAPAKA